jgi:hypothetical protein
LVSVLPLVVVLENIYSRRAKKILKPHYEHITAFDIGEFMDYPLTLSAPVVPSDLFMTNINTYIYLY